MGQNLLDEETFKSISIGDRWWRLCLTTINLILEVALQGCNIKNWMTSHVEWQF